MTDSKSRRVGFHETAMYAAAVQTERARIVEIVKRKRNCFNDVAAAVEMFDAILREIEGGGNPDAKKLVAFRKLRIERDDLTAKYDELAADLIRANRWRDYARRVRRQREGFRAKCDRLSADLETRTAERDHYKDGCDQAELEHTNGKWCARYYYSDCGDIFPPIPEWKRLRREAAANLTGLYGRVATLKARLDKAVTALKKLKLEFKVVHCDCGKPWADTDAHDIVRAALAEIHEEGPDDG